MSSTEHLLDRAAEAIVVSELEKALGFLSQAERQMHNNSDNAQSLQQRLERLSNLALAASEGISDARELIHSAASAARKTSTYDREGRIKNVRQDTPSIRRF